MTFLPLIERELSVRARRRGNYWLRFGVALTAALFALPQLLVTDWRGGTSAVGKYVFNGLVVVAFLLCSGAFLLTADAVGSEQREGTLGLLFLTRVSWFDVMLGKLGANGITGLLALTALLPLLMIPVLAGGVNGSEALRKGVALLDTLFLSLSIGLYSSAAAEERFKALRRSGIWVLLIWFVFPIPFLVLYIGVGAPVPCAVSPLMLTILAGDSRFAGSNSFWIAAGAAAALGFLFLGRAGVRLRGSVRDEQPAQVANETPAHLAVRVPGPMPLSGNRWRLSRFSCSPEQWVTTRQRGMRTILWVGAIVGFHYLFSYAFFFMGWRAFSRVGFARSMAGWLPGVILSAASGAFFAWAASRFFIEGRKSGELELLLTTPVGAQSIVWGQWRSLRRALRGPIAAMLVSLFLPFAFSMLNYSTISLPDADMIMLSSTISFVLSGMNVFFGVQALCLAGLWFGIRASGQVQAILWTIAVAKGCPYLFSLLGPLLLGVLGLAAYSNFRSAYHLLAFVPSLATLLFYLWLIRTAKRKLLKPFAVSEPTLPPISTAIRRLFLSLPDTIVRAGSWRES